MASHHHHHHTSSRRHNHHNQTPLAPTSPHCCTFQHSPPCCPPPPPPDNLLHLLSSYLQTHQQETPFPNQTCSCKQKNLPIEQDQVILSCLLRKIDTLESSLNKFAPFYNQRRYRDRYSTVRDSAARVIQTHFRSYLVRRAVSFRHLKELALIKSSFLSLKSSVSGKPIFNFRVVSRKVTDLLLRLDSIQGRVDPMIWKSKRSLSRDLVRFLQYVDDCVVTRYEFVSHSKRAQGVGVVEERRVGKLRNPMGKVFVGCDGDEELDYVTDDSEEVYVDKRIKFRTGANVVKPPVRRAMVVDKNRNVYQVCGKTSGEERRVERLRNRMGRVFVTCDGDEDSNEELEELDSETDGSEELTMDSTDKRNTCGSKFRNVAIVKGNVVKPPVKKNNRNVYEVYGNKDDVTSSAEDDSVDSGEEEARDDEKKHGLKTRNMVLVKGGGGKDRVVKTVSFDENGNVYKVYGDTPEASTSEEGDSTSGSNDGYGDKKGNNGNEVVEIKYVPKENKGVEEDEEAHSENKFSSSDVSEGDARDANNPGSNEHNRREIQVHKGNLMFSPPLPLKMEP